MPVTRLRVLRQMPHPVPAVCAVLMRGAAVRAPRSGRELVGRAGASRLHAPLFVACGCSGVANSPCSARCWMTPLPRNYTAQAQAQVGGGFRSREPLPGQTAADRPDLVARVFKLDALLTDLWATVFSDTCGREFTRCVYLSITFDIVRHARVLARYEPHVEQVEWQKRGLPHAHILLILDEPIHWFDVYGLV